MPSLITDDAWGEGCPECERRRNRNRTIGKASGVLLVALAAGLAIRWYPTWAESIKVGVIVVTVVVTWLLARDAQDRPS